MSVDSRFTQALLDDEAVAAARGLTDLAGRPAAPPPRRRPPPPPPPPLPASVPRPRPFPLRSASVPRPRSCRRFTRRWAARGL